MIRLPSLRRLLGPLGNLHRSQSGTAMTEFAITLPIYLIFIIGILSIYEIQQGVLLSEQNAAAALWEDAIDYQTNPWRAEVVPLAGALTTGLFYDSIDEAVSFYGIADVVAAGGGMYPDSGAKAGAANLIPTINVSPDPKLMLTQIVCSPSHTRNLMDDLPNASDMNFGSFQGFASTVMNLTGTRPALAAGLRYGTVGGKDRSHFAAADGRFSAETLTYYVASAPTAPSDHFMGAVLTRLELGTNNGWRDTARFGWSNIGSGAGSVGSCP